MAKIEEKIADWMPLRLVIWRKGTAFFSPAERGAYMDLILAYWELGPLPSDDAILQQLARVTDSKTWKQVRWNVLDKFIEKDGVLYHERIDEERTVALQKFQRKSDAGRIAGQASAQARAKQTSTTDSTNRSTVGSTTGQPNVHTTYQVHTPNGVTQANACVAQAPKPIPSKGTRLASDWKPSEANRAYGRELGYADAEFDAECGEFREYFTGPNAAKPVKKCWDSALQRWLRENASRRFAKRNRAGQSGGNKRGAGSILAALGSVLDRQDGNPRDVGETVEVAPVFTGADAAGPAAPGGTPEGFGGSEGNVIDGEWTRVQEAPGGDEIPHAAAGRGH